MQINPLKNCGVEIKDIDITDLSDAEYIEIKNALLEHLVVVIKSQPVLTVPFAKIVHKVGTNGITGWWQAQWDKEGNPLGENHGIDNDPFLYNGPDDKFPVQRVTGEKKQGQVTGIFGSGTLDWHCNMNSAENANGVALQGVSPGVVGTSTSFMDTTKAYEAMSPELKKRCEGVWGVFEVAPEIWAEGMPEGQYRKIMEINQSSYVMPLLNKTYTGKTGLFFHYLNKCRFPKDPELKEILKQHCFQDQFIYTHWWEPGDIILMDQKHTLHKRDQDGDSMLEKRILHRYIFYLGKK